MRLLKVKIALNCPILDIYIPDPLDHPQNLSGLDHPSPLRVLLLDRSGHLKEL